MAKIIIHHFILPQSNYLTIFYVTFTKEEAFASLKKTQIFWYNDSQIGRNGELRVTDLLCFAQKVQFVGAKCCEFHIFRMGDFEVINRFEFYVFTNIVM